MRFYKKESCYQYECVNREYLVRISFNENFNLF